ncbi:MAG: hypothetical protein KBT20_10735 [Bacteroidales bacterium]|nr:hypothetical protein [Candidatus Liminaster caballi]
MAEHNKLWYLNEAIRLNAFATSANNLAKNIGYSGSSQLYRGLKNGVGGNSVNNTWEHICNEYGITDDELCEYVNIIGSANDLWKEVQAKAEELSIDVYTLGEQTLEALLLCDEEGMRRVLNLADWECLLDFSREHPFHYAHLIVIYYVHYKNIVRAYKGKIDIIGCEILESMYNRMHELQPENTMLKEMADAYRSQLRQMSGNGNLWENTLHTAFLVQSFTDPNFRINTLSTLRLLPISSDSLWMEHDTLKKYSGTAYIFFEVLPEGATGGRYDCIEVEASMTDKNLVVKRCFSFWMMEPDDDDEQGIAFMQFRDENGQRQIVRYIYDYDSERQNLHLTPADSDNPNCVKYAFPTEIHYVDDNHLMLEDERQWIAWYKDFMESKEDELFIEMMKSEGVVMEKDYEVTDVAISRRYLTATIGNGKDVADFRVELEKHPGLQHVKPMMDAAIFRHEDDNQQYLEWICPHISIPMKAMQKVAEYKLDETTE